MNLFILNRDPIIAAQDQCDKHVVKMIVESAQMLSTVHRMLDGIETKRPSKSGKTLAKYFELSDDREDVLYKAVHFNHPCTVWTRESMHNYRWHYKHFAALCDEYTYRYGKVHKSVEVINQLPLPQKMERLGFTTFGLAMPDELKDYENPIQSYRDYYHLDKATFSSWKYREKPPWWNEDYADYEKRITA